MKNVMNWIKRLIFGFISLIPILGIVSVVYYYAFHTNFPQNFYMNDLRNIYFGCLSNTNDRTVYRMASGDCYLENIEYKTVITSNEHGHRKTSLESSKPLVAVIGDSHAHGFGVNDEEVFASLLSSNTGFGVSNFAIGSYDTVRELEALSKFITSEEIVIIQYCDNDFLGNKYFIKNGFDKYISEVERDWKEVSEAYFARKDRGLIGGLSGLLSTLKSSRRKSTEDPSEYRNIDEEAEIFAAVLERYSDILEGKKVIVFESSEWGLNSTQFKLALDKTINEKNLSLNLIVLDSTKFLSKDDYYFLDDHLNAAGHEKIASKITQVLSQH